MAQPSSARVYRVQVTCVCCVCRLNSISDAEIMKMSNKVHAPLLKALAERVGYKDAGCVDFFKYGAPVVGALAK